MFKYRAAVMAALVLIAISCTTNLPIERTQEVELINFLVEEKLEAQTNFFGPTATPLVITHPTPLPTATPKPNATPQPTATPQPVPTPHILPPITHPTQHPYPTPAPTVTPVPTLTTTEADFEIIWEFLAEYGRTAIIDGVEFVWIEKP